jgi:hypothetical protein
MLAAGARRLTPGSVALTSRSTDSEAFGSAVWAVLVRH